jgi:hypothetical protein
MHEHAMGWMDAHEYLVIERTLRDRLEDVERFSLERAFHSESVHGEDVDRSLDRAAAPKRALDGHPCPPAMAA